MNKLKKISFIVALSLLIGLVILFLVAPETARSLFSTTKPGSVIAMPETTKTNPGPEPAKNDNIDTSAESWKRLLKDWGNLPLNEKEKFDQLANDIVFGEKWVGVTVLQKSNQDRNTNLYYKYAYSRIQNLNNPEKLHGDWLEPIFKGLPLFLQYAYAYEHKPEISIAKLVLPTLLNEYFNKKITLYDVAAYLHVFQRYPKEATSFLPMAIFLLKRDAKTIIQSKNNADIACGFAVYSVLQKQKIVDENEINLIEVANKVQLGANIYERAETAKFVMPGLYLLLNDSIKFSDEFTTLSKTLAYQLMMVLEPDGCLAQLGEVKSRINYRETLYYASEVFKTNDLRFVAQGAFRNDDTNKPLKNEIFIKSCGYYAVKSNWNLLDLVPEHSQAHPYQQFLGADASQLTFDVANQEISFYAYNRPLIKIKISGVTFDQKSIVISSGIEKQIDSKLYTVDEISFTNNCKITFIRKVNAFVLMNESPNLNLSIKTYRSQIQNDATEKTFKTVHKLSPMVFYSYTHEEKQKGDCYIKGEYQLNKFDQSETPHTEEGYYNLIELSQIKHLIVEGKPFLLPDMQERMPMGDSRVHEIYNLQLQNGDIKIKQTMTRLTLGRLKSEGKK